MLAGISSRLTYANVMASIAVFIALSAGAYAAGLAPDSVKSKQIKDEQVKDQDLAPGAVTTVKLGDGSITTGKVIDETLVGDDLADETVTGSKVVDETLTGSKVDDGSLAGIDVENDSLTGADIDETALSGVAFANGQGCCTLRSEVFEMGTAYNSGNPDTFVDLGFFEVRTSASASGNDSDGIQVCKIPGSIVPVPATVYMSGARSSVSFPMASNSCLSFDINGDATTSSFGDFELILNGDHVWGQAFGGSGASITVLEY